MYSLKFRRGKNPVTDPIRVIRQGDAFIDLPTLRKVFGQNKTFFPGIELPALVALSYYSDLKNTPIQFIKAPIRSTMEARPVLNSLFGRRKYFVYVNSHPQGTGGVSYKEIPFNALIGLIGHELAHIKEYERMDFSTLSNIALNYYNSPFRKAFERNTDLATIKRGLGWQLYDWSRYIMENEDVGEQYRQEKKKHYMKPQEIKRELMKKHTIQTTRPLFSAQMVL